MQEKKTFSLGQVLTVIGGKGLCVGGIKELKEIIDFLAQMEVPSYTLYPIVAEFAKPEIISIYPDLNDLTYVWEFGHHWKWLEERERQFGEALEINSLSEDCLEQFQKHLDSIKAEQLTDYMFPAVDLKGTEIE